MVWAFWYCVVISSLVVLGLTSWSFHLMSVQLISQQKCLWTSVQISGTLLQSIAPQNLVILISLKSDIFFLGSVPGSFKNAFNFPSLKDHSPMWFVIQFLKSFIYFVQFSSCLWLAGLVWCPCLSFCIKQLKCLFAVF